VPYSPAEGRDGPEDRRKRRPRSLIPSAPDPGPETVREERREASADADAGREPTREEFADRTSPTKRWRSITRS